MPINSSRSFGSFYRIIFIFCVEFTTIYSANAKDVADEYITVEKSNTNLLQFFELVEKQTSFIFAYDEYEVNLSQELKLLTGQQLLKSLLDSASKQANLQFNQKGKTILVIVRKTLLQKAAILVKGVVKDAAGNPLGGATVSVKGTAMSVRTDEG